MIDRLKIILLDQILVFESYSRQKAAKLADEIQNDGRLKNPLLVYPMADKYLMLDNRSLFEAIKLTEVSHIPVQIADHNTVSAHSWQRILENWNIDDLTEFCKRFPRQITILKNPTGLLSPDQAEVIFPDRQRLRLNFNSDSHLVRADIYVKFGEMIGQDNSGYRAILQVGDVDCLDLYPGASAAIFPPIFGLDELGSIAYRKILLPEGVVRIDQPGRILGIDYSLSILRENVSPEEKESFLKQLIRMRMHSDRTAYYNSSIFMFNN